MLDVSIVQEPTGGAVINPSILEWCNVRDGGTWDLRVTNAANSRVLGRRLLPPIILPFTFFPSNCLNRSFSSQVHFVLSLSDPSFPCLSYHPGPLSRDAKCQQVFPQTSCCVRFGGRRKRTPVTPGWLTAESRGLYLETGHIWHQRKIAWRKHVFIYSKRRSTALPIQQTRNVGRWD